MKRIKQFLPFVFAGIIALFLVACGGSKAPEGGDTTAQPGFNFVQLDKVSGATITATGEAEATQIFDLTLKDGEAFVCTGVTETGEWEIVITQNDSEIATDPLAIDQAAIDLVYAMPDSGSLVRRIESRNGLHTLDTGEQNGLGSRYYNLVILND